MVWAVMFDDKTFIHENPDYHIGRTRKLQLTDDIEKAKIWQKLGMLKTYMKKNGVYAPDTWFAVPIEVTRKLQEVDNEL